MTDFVRTKAILLGFSRDYNRIPTKLVACNIDDEAIPLEPSVRTMPTEDFFMRDAVNVFSLNAEPLNKISSKQL
ncbi:hypothetical protein P8R33_06230 [Qipengyuania sp. XHP0211]|uniref:hypothetical protein n=1 Tax=Qipengyuania sp. XHP0211 TaxID=3038079 RepID=UPI00241DD02D|nr:hypothetical protein [Qipengyuania sp. XHP0211]MDG5750692.1 hypothetical protein [Qipengyuania sp. XHP0211]